MILAGYALLAHALVVLLRLRGVPDASWIAASAAVVLEADGLLRLFGARAGLRGARNGTHRPLPVLAVALGTAVLWRTGARAFRAEVPPLGIALAAAGAGVAAHLALDVLGVRGVRWSGLRGSGKHRLAAGLLADGDPVTVALLAALLVVPRTYELLAAAGVLGVIAYLVVLRAAFRRRARALVPGGAILVADPRGLAWFRAILAAPDDPASWRLLTVDGGRRVVLAEWFAERLVPKTALETAFAESTIAPAREGERIFDAAIAPGSAGWPTSIRAPKTS